MGQLTAHRPARQMWFTAQEIADKVTQFGIASLPSTKSGVVRLIRRQEWQSTQHCRERAGSEGGGGFEYHVHILPEILQTKLMSEYERTLAKIDRQACEVQRQEVRSALTTVSLNARQRMVMDARMAVLNAIDGVRIETGCTVRQAIMAAVNNPAVLELSDEVIARANDRAKGSIKLSRSGLYKWFSERDQRGVAALAPLPTKQKQDIPDWFWKMMRFYAQPAKPTLTVALEKYIENLPEGTNEVPPNYDQVRRLMKRLGNVEKHRGREGSLTLKARLSYVTRSTGDLLPTCVYTADGKTFDAEVQHPFHGGPFRPEITSIVDVATRKCVGFSVSLAENQWAVADALRHAVEQHGIPAIFYVDNGSGFKNDLLDQAYVGLADRLGVTKKHSLPYSSQARGIIERFNGTVWNPLSKDFDTYIGADMDRQRKQLVHKVTRKDLKEFGTSARLPRFDDFISACKQAITVYNNRRHSALNMTPNEAWQQHVESGFEPVTLLDGEADDLFRPYTKRRVRRCLIEFNKNRYYSAALTEYHGDDVYVGYDIHDGSKVWVRSIDEVDRSTGLGRLIAIAEFNGNETSMFPVSVVDAAHAKRAVGREKRAQRRIDEIHDERDAHRFIENDSFEQSPFTIDVTPSMQSEDAEDMDIIVNDNRKIKPKMRFEGDDDFALWAIAHPDKLSASQVDALRECLSNQESREILEMSGVDLERLKAVIRNAA